MEFDSEIRLETLREREFNRSDSILSDHFLARHTEPKAMNRNHTFAISFSFIKTQN